MASDALWIVSFKCVVKGYQKCRFDVKDGEVFKVLKKIGETGRAFRNANEHGQLGHLQHVLFCSSSVVLHDSAGPGIVNRTQSN